MEKFCGKFIRSESIIGTYFILESKGKIYKCFGIAPELYPGTPIVVTGKAEFEDSKNITVENIGLDTTDDQKMIYFLSGRCFKKVGMVAARRIVESLNKRTKESGLTSYGELKYEDIQECLKEAKTPKEAALKITLALTGIQERSRLYEKIKEFGGRLPDAESLYKKYFTGAWQAFKNDPYIGIGCGLSFNLCDKAAKNFGVDIFDKNRIRAICRVIADKTEASGNCCVKLSELKRMIHDIQKNSAFEPVADATIMTAVLSSREFIIDEDPGYGHLVYPHRLYQIEQVIADELFRLNSQVQKLPYKGYNGYFKPDKDQLKAIELVRTTGIKIITGGPGTGKTTTIKEIIKAYEDMGLGNPIFLCAPTGAAAARITQAIDGQLRAVTIHKQLDVRALGDNDYIFMYNKKRQLSKGLYIIDEMSMVGEQLFLNLLQAIPSGSLVILSGDIEQLQSVSAGTVLKDIIDSGCFETARLTTIHRQAKDDLIITNYLRILDKQTSLLTGKNFIIEEYQTSDDLIRATARYFKKWGTDSQILSFTRKGNAGKVHIDSLITQAKSRGRERFLKTDYYDGDKIMIIRNNYRKGYWNGDIGIITGLTMSSVTAQFYDGIRILSEEDLMDTEHAWCCTIHKMQGNENDNIILVVDDEYPNMLYRSIMLTAITRAKKNVVIIAKKGAIEKALKSEDEIIRVTGLCNTLKRKIEDVKRSGSQSAC